MNNEQLLNIIPEEKTKIMCKTNNELSYFVISYNYDIDRILELKNGRMYLLPETSYFIKNKLYLSFSDIFDETGKIREIRLSGLKPPRVRTIQYSDCMVLITKSNIIPFFSCFVACVHKDLFTTYPSKLDEDRRKWLIRNWNHSSENV